MNNRDTEIILDWRAYFELFDREHYGSPVFVGGRLLYRDGWQYSASDYAGPEWSPPEDEKELSSLKLLYWAHHQQRMANQLALKRVQFDALDEMQIHKNRPLQRVVRYRDEDGYIARKTEDVDFEDLRSEIIWLEQEVRECTDMINKIEEKRYAAV